MTQEIKAETRGEQEDELNFIPVRFVFDEMFVPSLSVGGDGQAVFDWTAFHQLQSVPFNRKHLIFGAHS